MVQPIFFDEIKHEQVGDEEIERIKANISKGKVLHFVGDKLGVIRFQNRICRPQRMGLKEKDNI